MRTAIDARRAGDQRALPLGEGAPSQAGFG